MPQIFYTDAEYRELLAQKQALESKLATVEAQRPAWAQGYTDDGVAAQGFSNALYTLWAKLKVSDQTQAVLKLGALIERERKLEEVAKREMSCSFTNDGYPKTDEELNTYLAIALTRVK